jgi:hypothetical protein
MVDGFVYNKEVTSLQWIGEQVTYHSSLLVRVTISHAKKFGPFTFRSTPTGYECLLQGTINIHEYILAVPSGFPDIAGIIQHPKFKWIEMSFYGELEEENDRVVVQPARVKRANFSASGNGLKIIFQTVSGMCSILCTNFCFLSPKSDVSNDVFV